MLVKRLGAPSNNLGKKEIGWRQHSIDEVLAEMEGIIFEGGTCAGPF